MLGVIRQMKAVPKRHQRSAYTPEFCKLIYYHLGEIHPTQHDESDSIESTKTISDSTKHTHTQIKTDTQKNLKT